MSNVEELKEEIEQLRLTIKALVDENNTLRIELAKSQSQLDAKKRRSMFDPPIRESEKLGLGRNTQP